MKPMKIYVASSWRNEFQPDVVSELRKNGFDVYDFKENNKWFHWTDIDPNWKQWNFKDFDHALQHEIANKGYGKDYHAMEEADACVLVLPAGRSAHMEAGWCKGERKYTCVYFPPEMPFTSVDVELMYKLADYISMDISFIITHLKNHEKELKERDESFMRSEF